MRRTDREVTDFNEIVEIIKKCDVCRLGINGEKVPYIVPLNFGEEIDNGKIVLYFHSAQVGRKHKLIEKDNNVFFEMDCGHTLFFNNEKGSCSMAFESVMGDGVIDYIENETEKIKGLNLIMEHYGRSDFDYNKDVIPYTSVFRLTINSFTAKRRIMK